MRDRVLKDYASRAGSTAPDSSHTHQKRADMIHVVATIELKPGTRSRFLEDFAQLAPEVRAEDGCIEYGAAVDLPSGIGAQVPLRADVVTVVEKWKSPAALRAHLDAAHMVAHRQRVGPFAIRTTLQVLEPAGV